MNVLFHIISWFHITPSALQQKWTTEQKVLGFYPWCQGVDAKCWSDRFTADWLALGPQLGRQQNDCYVWAAPLMKSRHSARNPPAQCCLAPPQAPFSLSPMPLCALPGAPPTLSCPDLTAGSAQKKKTNPNEPHLILVAARRGSLGCLSVAAAPVLGTGSALLVAGHLW